jgi:phosphatidylglycerophosphatase A
MMILGVNLLVGGFIVTVIMTGQIMDLQFVIQHSLSQSSAIGLFLTGIGFLMLSAGFVMVVYYDCKKSWHLGEVEKTEKVKNRKITIRTTRETLEELTQEKRKDA